jgi:hypothetical protein
MDASSIAALVELTLILTLTPVSATHTETRRTGAVRAGETKVAILPTEPAGTWVARDMGNCWGMRRRVTGLTSPGPLLPRSRLYL